MNDRGRSTKNTKISKNTRSWNSPKRDEQYEDQRWFKRRDAETPGSPNTKIQKNAKVYEGHEDRRRTRRAPRGSTPGPNSRDGTTCRSHDRSDGRTPDSRVVVVAPSSSCPLRAFCFDPSLSASTVPLPDTPVECRGSVSFAHPACSSVRRPKPRTMHRLTRVRYPSRRRGLRRSP